MRLIVGLMLRVTAVVLICLVGAAAWVVTEVHQGIGEETTASADRVVREAQQLAWRELTWRGSAGRLAKYAFPDWRTSHTLRYISPGNCVALTWEGEATQQQCSGLETAGPPAPRWFETLYRGAFGPSLPVRRSVILNRREAGSVVTTPDQGAAVRQVWRQVRVLLAAAAAMAAGIAILATMVIGIALRPARLITRGLRRLEDGDLSARLPTFRAGEFDRIARAVNAMAARLALTMAERTALTQRLFAVQEEERRALARDLHDEFGQCLTATGALASAILAEVPDRPDVAADARSIARNTGQMMQTLKGALARLRPPDLDELGLERSLRRLVATRDRGANRPVSICLAVDGDFTGLPGATSLAIYRIVQESLTNALRHGAPSEIRVDVAHAGAVIAIRVEDDGGGDPAGIGQSGHGLLGIRERVAALGGGLTLSRAVAGVRIEATIPAATPLSPDAPVTRREVAFPDAAVRGLAA